jgi:hypothetical protein
VRFISLTLYGVATEYIASTSSVLASNVVLPPPLPKLKVVPLAVAGPSSAASQPNEVPLLFAAT